MTVLGNHQIDGDPAGPPLLLCHALGADLTLWDAQVEAMARDYRVVRYDLPGHGRWAAPAGPVTMSSLAADAVALLDGLGIERAHIVGAALGAMVGLRVAVDHPDRVHSLVLANASARAGTPAAWEQRAALALNAGMGAVADFVLPKYFTVPFAAAHPDVVAATRATVEQANPVGYAACCGALRDADLREAAVAVSVRTLIVSAEHDVLTTPADGRELYNAIDGSSFAQLDAAHLSCIERAAEFNAVVGRFLAAGPVSP